MNFPLNAFGDPFDILSLPLRRKAQGYAVQKLDTDLLLDQHSGTFLPVRSEQLDALFPSFRAAHKAAENWLGAQDISLDCHEIAIVPASYDNELHRHILIYGVLRSQP